MKAIINGINIEGTPQEILEYQRLQGRADKLPFPKPWIMRNLSEQESEEYQKAMAGLMQIRSAAIEEIARSYR